MPELSMTKCLGKKLSRRTNTWLYQFECVIPSCKRILQLQRAAIAEHCGLCDVHQKAARKDGVSVTGNFHSITNWIQAQH